jgi:GTP-binding protein
MTKRIAIIGRPNVGKSTLFNRLTGSKRAIVHDTPGVTRDRLEAESRLADLRFTVVDTAGLELGMKQQLSERLVTQTLAGLETADVGLFVIDARTGITPLDEEIAGLLRGQHKPVILIVNKCEARAGEAEAQAAWSLGLGEPIPISAEHGLGLDLVADALRPHLEQETSSARAEPAGEAPEAAEAGPLHLAIVGRPNVGKSSLINRLIKEQRLLTGPEPGLTRDAVDIEWEWRGRPIRLVDTAGLRRKTRIEAAVEKLSASASLRAIRNCHVAVLLIDATEPLEKQELTIANRVLEEGRALVIAANKWDLVENPDETLAEIRFRLKHKLAQLKSLPLVTLSVKTGRGLDKLLPTVIETVDRWSTRISTGRLNRWLTAAVEKNPPPMAQNRRIKIRYATQVSTRPPTIALFANKPEGDLPDAYKRYLEASFVEAFGLGGVAVRMVVRHGDNPFHEAQR